jgi:hypothetical protein
MTIGYTEFLSIVTFRSLQTVKLKVVKIKKIQCLDFTLVVIIKVTECPMDYSHVISIVLFQRITLSFFFFSFLPLQFSYSRAEEQ